VEGVITVKRDGQPAYAKNTLVYLGDTVEGAKPTKPALMAQQGRAFDKVVLPIVRRGVVRFTNEETLENIYHHVFSPDPKVGINSKKYRPTDDPYDTRPLDRVGPITVFCDIHKEMISTVYVVPNDFYTLLSSAEGATAPYKLQGIPAGKHKLTVWHRSAKAPLEVDVVIQDGKTTKLDITLEGTTEIEASLLKHQRRDKVDYRALMPDGGSPGESEDKWK